MKLKKIASLALAGIMAVSMLAGCNGASSSTPTDPETPTTPVTDAASTVNGELGDVADLLTFTNDLGATKIMESYFDETPIVMSQWNKAALSVNNNLTAIGNLVDELDTYLGVAGDSWIFNNGLQTATTSDSNDGTYMEMYLLNDDYYNEEEALKLVGQYLAKLNLPEDNTDVNGVTSAQVVNYSYTGTVAAVKAESKSGAESMWVIMVSINRDSAKR